MPYKIALLTADAAYPRYPGSTPLSTDRLKIAYIKYTNIAQPPPDAIVFNVLFAHGTGMNKVAFRTHIDKLFEYAELVGHLQKWFLNLVVAFDLIGHGDSAVLNQGKLGWVFRWEDQGRDVLELIKQQQDIYGDFYNDASHKAILIGHSFGATCNAFAAVFDHSAFDTVIALEPVSLFGDPDTAKAAKKRFAKLAHIIKDKFPDEETYYKSFKRSPVFLGFDKTIAKDIAEAEKWSQPDGSYRTKALTQQQMITYLGAMDSVPRLMNLYKTLRLHFVHVIGLKSAWNPPDANVYVRDQIPSEFLTTYDLEEGEHNVFAQRPEDFNEVIRDVILKRAEVGHANWNKYPEVKFRGKPLEMIQDEIAHVERLLKDPNAVSYSKAQAEPAAKL